MDSFWLISTAGMRTGVLAICDQVESDRLVSVAEQIQEFVHEELSKLGRPAAWPICPEHPRNHPLSPAVVDGEPCWQCPISSIVADRIGYLNAVT